MVRLTLDEVKKYYESQSKMITEEQFEDYKKRLKEKKAWIIGNVISFEPPHYKSPFFETKEVFIITKEEIDNLSIHNPQESILETPNKKQNPVDNEPSGARIGSSNLCKNCGKPESEHFKRKWRDPELHKLIEHTFCTKYGIRQFKSQGGKNEK